MFNEILKLFDDGKMDIETANKELEEAGAGFVLKPREDSGWTEEEMEQGFREGKEAKPVRKRVDFSRRPDRAGKIVHQRIASGAFYAVYYDKNGYAYKAVKQ